ncbi:hypothetical protein C3F09_07765 [candidate division GN15 bacterium]|uniref:Isochorismate synthase MenF n=1 Tax=candidate division GN15 bacterium TaxID=2072418 RepID=A0A855X617_9BACT|nr:MAG: hypothetical protein C3F09_07765 [candidate division GN15 bacterium]
MSLVRVKRPADTIAEAIAALNEQVLHTVSRRRIEQREIVRVEVALKPFDTLAWISSQREGTKYYWRDWETGADFAGIGAIDSVAVNTPDDLHHLEARMTDSAESALRWFGGLPFDSERAASGGIGPGRFVLPGIEVESTRDAAKISCNIALHDSRLYSRLACLGDIDPYLRDGSDIRVSGHYRESTSPEMWHATIDRVLASITAGNISKLVPARQRIIPLNMPLNPWQALERLREQGGAVSLFGFQIEDGRTFIGASPERLFTRRGNSIRTEAIAGTIARGTSRDEDTRLADKLMQSSKDRREHDLVVDYLQQSLDPVTESLVVDKTSVLVLPRLQHLRTSVSGTLCEKVSDADLLAALHPTPAVAGSPRDRAVQLIREIEPFDRGWYAGPIGWVSREASEFAVGIRSVLVTGNQLVLTAGAGIVEGSDPRAEWEETEQKFQSTMDVILP